MRGTRVIEANGDRVTWTYDATYQLLSERRSGANAYAITYTYDKSNNRRTMLQTGITTTYASDSANEMLTYKNNTGTTTLIYDANGNQIGQIAPAGGRTTNTWDLENRLTGVILPSGVRNTLIYDGLGKRVEADASGGITKLIWDAQRLLLETDQNGTTQVTYSLEPSQFGNLVSQQRSSASYYYHFDGLGSTDRMTDSAASVRTSYTYQAFGNIVFSNGTITNNLRFIGRLGCYWNSDTGLVLMGARIELPVLGRFSSVDPSGSSIVEMNPYLYVRNSPMIAVDPNGTIVITVIDGTTPDGKPLPKPPKNCGDKPGFFVYDYKLNVKAPCTGYLVQKIVLICKIEKCTPCVKCPDDKTNTVAATMWEAFRIDKDEVLPWWRVIPGGRPDYTDLSAITCTQGTCGYKRAVGELKFYCKEKADDPDQIGTGDLDSKWKTKRVYGSAGCFLTSGQLPSIGFPAADGMGDGTEPDFWRERPVEGPVERVTTGYWNCCEGQENFCKPSSKPEK